MNRLKNIARRFRDFQGVLLDLRQINSTFIQEVIKNSKTGKRQGLEFNDRLIKTIHEHYAPVFVLSTGRCGTKYLSTLLKIIPQADVYHKPKPELSVYSKYAYEHYQSQQESIKLIVDAARIELILKSYAHNRNYIETNNRITFFAYALAELYPQSKFLHLVRHPAVFVRSGIRRNWYMPEDRLKFARITPVDTSVQWSKMTAISRLTWLWDETNSFIEKFKESLEDQNRVMTVRAEDMFKDFDTVCAILKFMNLPLVDKDKLIKASKKKINVQKSGDFPVYTDWTSEQKEDLAKYLKVSNTYNYRL